MKVLQQTLAPAITILILSIAPPTWAIDFPTEILPVLTRAGCNAGACHGSAAGRGGFRLSLLGGDPSADYESIVEQFEGRRINLAQPRESLLLGKPTGRLDHEGGVPLSENGEGAKRLLAWIAAGASRGGARKLTHFEVSPSRGTVEQLGAVRPLRATARFDNGPNEDVTAWTVFTSSDPASVEIDVERNVATVLRRGQHVVIARFLDRVIPVTLTLPLSEAVVDLSNKPRTNFIDDEVLKKLASLRLPVASAADDASYLRRVRIALTGSLPARDEAEAFLGDHSDDKRMRLVDRILDSEAFVDYWTYRFAILFRIHALPNDRLSARVYHHWLHEQIRSGTPLDEIARELLTSTGDSHVIGPANFARMSPDARAQAELVSQVFLGVRLQCANCHNHPLDRWIQDDYHGLAAVFSRLERGRIVSVAARGAVTNLRTGEPAIPRLPGLRYLDPNADGRAEFVNWLTAADNPYFSPALVNRLWQAMFGRGLVEPVDDLRGTNPATHPELLDRLAADFVEHKYDLRHMLRRIATSETFGRGEGAREPGDTFAADDRFYSHVYCRPLEPEILADAIADVTGISDQYGDEPLGTRAIALFDPATPSPSLDILGRCSRMASCEGTPAGGGLPARLHQLNGELINRKIVDPKGRLHRRIDAGSSNEAIVDDFYLRALSRLPNEAERKYWQREWADVSAAERTSRLEDFVWSLLNCDEFTTNH